MNSQNNILKAEKAFFTKKHDCEETGNAIDPLYSVKIRVPTYQRPYSWKKDQIAQLLKDLWECERYSEYFLGNVILINDRSTINKCDVVDGQQRITSMFLIHLWFRNYFNEKHINDHRKNIDLIDDCDFEMSFEDNELLSEIRLIKKNEKYVDLFKSISKKGGSDFKKRQTKTFKVVMNEIHKFFSAKTQSDLVSFFDFVCDNVFCLRIIDNPNGTIGDLLFCSLNGKGLPLDQTDIIKSFFIRDFMKTNTDMNTFKKMWSDLLVNTQDNLKREFSTYFAWKSVKLKGRKWTSEVEKYLEKNKKSLTRRELFQNLHSWCEGSQQIRSLNSGEPTIDFFNKINAFFKFEKSKEIIYYFSDLNVKDKRCKKDFIRFLELVFKLNFLIVSLQGEKPKQFIEGIVDEVREMALKSENKNDSLKLFKEVNSWLEERLFEYVNKKKIFSDFSPMTFSYSKAVEKRIIKLLLILERCFDPNTKTFDYAQGCDVIDLDLDHILAKWVREQNDEFIYRIVNNNGSNEVEFNADVFCEVMEACDLRQNMSYSDFCNSILNKHINLHFGSSHWNKTKSNKLISLSQAKKIFSINNLRSRNELLLDLFYLFINEKTRKESARDFGGIEDLWVEIEKTLKQVTNFRFDASRGGSANVQLLDEAYEGEYIGTKDDLSLLHDLRKKRNSIVHSGAREFLRDKEYKRVVEIIEDLKTYLV